MAAMLGSFRELSVPGRVLVVDQFGIDVGSHLVLLFHLVSAAAVGAAGAAVTGTLQRRGLLAGEQVR